MDFKNPNMPITGVYTAERKQNDTKNREKSKKKKPSRSLRNAVCRVNGKSVFNFVPKKRFYDVSLSHARVV